MPNLLLTNALANKPLKLVHCASADQKKTSSNSRIEFGTPRYFMWCGLAGGISCGTTHLVLAPLDLVKCLMQTEPKKYKSTLNGFKLVIKEKGYRGLARGWASTFIGYSLQGMGKFGFYELFKNQLTEAVGQEAAYAWRTSLYLTASASAEFLADIMLCPLEACKVRIQTQTKSSSQLRKTASYIYREEGFRGFYKSIGPLWMRQVPYTMMKFTCFERTVEILYKMVGKQPKQCSKSEQLLVTFTAGYIAGVFCAIVSHPADSVISKLNQDSGSSALKVAKKLGFSGLWKGLATRIVIVGTLTGAQWFVYDAIKLWLGIPRPPPMKSKSS